MSLGVNQLNSINYLIGETFGAGRGAGSKGLGGIAGLNTLQLTSQEFLQSVDYQRTFNRTELALRNSAQALNKADAASVFNQTAATTSDAAKVTATTAAGAMAGAYKVGVAQLAAGQKSIGAAMPGAAPTALAPGLGQLEFNINGQKKLVTYQLTGGETNQQALAAIGNAVNARNIGVTAALTLNPATGDVRLNLEGAPGAANAFTVTDTVGNAAAATGVANPAAITQAAQDAKFSVNGTNFTAAGNQVQLGATGVTLNLKQTTGGAPVTVTVASDTSQAEAAVRGFVAQYNDTIGRLQGNTSIYSMQSLATLKTLTGANANNLRSIGVDVGVNGTLKINEQKLTQTVAQNPGAVSDAFNGPNRYAAAVQAESERAINQSLGAPAGIGFSNYFNRGFSYSYGINSYISQNLGLFLNGLY